MLTGIDPEFHKQVASVLKWLCFSVRPLYLEEAAEIFILDPESDPAFDPEKRLFEPDQVLRYLRGLVVTTSGTWVSTFGYRRYREATKITA
jgi:hypothetical protein